MAYLAMSQAQDAVRSYLEENPKMIGVLFTILLLLAEAGQVAGAGMSSTAGP